METALIIGKQIRENRLSMNLRMSDLAKKTDITRATLSSIENGKANCSIKTLLKLIDALGMQIDISNTEKHCINRSRASRTNTARDKKINSFLVFCVEQYASFANVSGSQAFKKMKETDLIDWIIFDYDDLHGYSTEYLNNFISDWIRNRE